MSGENRFGKIISPAAVEQAVVATLNVWMDDYLGELERIDGWAPGEIQRPLGIITTSEFEKWPEDQIPVILVMNAGLAQPPERFAEGRYAAVWTVGIAPVVSDKDADSTRRLAGTYAAAVRAAISQHKMLKSPLHPDGFADFSNWHDETYHDLSFQATRSLGSAHVVFRVGVESVVTEQAGPRTPYTPSSTDPGPWPDVEEVTTTAEPKLATEAVH